MHIIYVCVFMYAYGCFLTQAYDSVAAPIQWLTRNYYCVLSGMPLALLFNVKKYGEGFQHIELALVGTSYECEGECVQLLIRSRDMGTNTSLHGPGSVGILAVNVRSAPVSIPPTVIANQNGILAVLPNCNLPSDLQTPIDLFDVDLLDHRREVLECILDCARLHSAVSCSSVKKNSSRVCSLLTRKLYSWDAWLQCRYCFWWIEGSVVCSWCKKYLEEGGLACSPKHSWCRLQLITTFLRTGLCRRPLFQAENLYHHVAIFLA